MLRAIGCVMVILLAECVAAGNPGAGPTSSAGGANCRSILTCYCSCCGHSQVAATPRAHLEPMAGDDSGFTSGGSVSRPPSHDNRIDIFAGNVDDPSMSRW